MNDKDYKYTLIGSLGIIIGFFVALFSTVPFNTQFFNARAQEQVQDIIDPLAVEELPYTSSTEQINFEKSIIDIESDTSIFQRKVLAELKNLALRIDSVCEK